MDGWQWEPTRALGAGGPKWSQSPNWLIRRAAESTMEKAKIEGQASGNCDSGLKLTWGTPQVVEKVVFDSNDSLLHLCPLKQNDCVELQNAS